MKEGSEDNENTCHADKNIDPWVEEKTVEKRERKKNQVNRMILSI